MKIEAFLTDSRRYANFVARDGSGRPIGLAERVVLYRKDLA